LRVAPIPESSFTGRSDLLLGGLLSIDVYGERFWPAYTQGDNSLVVATDTMKNLTYEVALEYDGATAEGLCALLAGRFLDAYSQIDRIGVRFRERPYEGYTDKLLGFRGVEQHAVELVADRTAVIALESRRRALRLTQLTGSAFTRFVREGHPT